MKSVDANDSTDMSMWQTSERESLLPFSREGENSAQLFQLFNVFEQPELRGWPLMTPMKVQMLKCKKCSREFCGTINYRRHVRVHRRSLNVDKDSHKIRDVLAAFWDKLSLEKAKEIVSFEDVVLKEVSGSSIINTWAMSFHTLGVWTLPQDYVRSGSTLLDIIQDNHSGLPISSQELFCVLDDASERTFLCAGTAESVQNYVFDGDVAKIALELKNLVACISFLFEQKLVKAWVADKDAEALRCQKLLVEEEEASQKRLAKVIERKKQRKLRQKEQKSSKGQSIQQKPVLDASVSPLHESIRVEESCLSATSDSNSVVAPDKPSDIIIVIEPNHFSDTDTRIDQIQCLDSNSVPPTMVFRQRRLRKSPRDTKYGFHEEKGQNLQSVQPQPSQKLNKVWTKKIRSENDDDNVVKYISEDDVSKLDVNKSEVIIGSISVSVPVRNHFSRRNNIGSIDAPSGPTDTEQSNSVNPHCTVSRADESNPGSMFSSFAARDFLAKRWKDAMSADHVKLVLSPEPGELTEGRSTQAVITTAKAKISITNQEKGEKIRYIQKQKVAA